MTIKNRLKNFWDEYGPNVIGIYILICVVSLIAHWITGITLLAWIFFAMLAAPAALAVLLLVLSYIYIALANLYHVEHPLIIRILCCIVVLAIVAIMVSKFFIQY